MKKLFYTDYCAHMVICKYLCLKIKLNIQNKLIIKGVENVKCEYQININVAIQ
jgi:hypothetical protein